MISEEYSAVLSLEVGILRGDMSAVTAEKPRIAKKRIFRGGL